MASCWFILLSFVGKLSALIHAVPSAVIGGVFAVVCVIILLSGFRVIKNEEFSERELYIIGVPLILAIGLLFMPAEIKQETPQFLQYLLDSPIALSAIAAIVMNKLIPVKKRFDKVSAKDAAASERLLQSMQQAFMETRCSAAAFCYDCVNSSNL